jgi:hypothetical protein
MMAEWLYHSGNKMGSGHPHETKMKHSQEMMIAGEMCDRLANDEASNQAYFEYSLRTTWFDLYDGTRPQPTYSELERAARKESRNNAQYLEVLTKLLRRKSLRWWD